MGSARRTNFGLAMVFLLAMTGLVATLNRADASPAGFSPAYEAVTCPTEVTALTEPGSVLTCGFLTALEDHSDSAGRTIRLFVVQAAPETGGTLPDPIFVPGRDLVGRSPSSIPFGYRADRLVITMDRRGGGRSEPNLACPEVRQLTAAGTHLVLGSSQTKAALLAAVEACHDRLTSRGIDLDMYNVAEMAADAEDLRIALGYDEWNLLTYGTASAITLEILRRFADHIRSATFDSPLPPTVDRFTAGVAGTEYAFHQIVAACYAEPSCHRAYPHLRRAWREALRQLHEHPSAFSDEDLDVVVDDATAVRYLRNNMAQGINETNDVAEFPLAIDDLRTRGWENGGAAGNEVGWASTPPSFVGYEVQWGDPSALLFEALAGRWVGRPTEGTFYSYMCHDEVPFVDTDALIAAAGDRPWYIDAYLNDPYPEICGRWDVSAALTDPHDAVASDVPVLMMSGQFDPYSPYPLVRRGTDGFTRKLVVRVPARSRNVLSVDCTVDLRNAFIMHPNSRLDTSCLKQIREAEPITFVLPRPASRQPRIDEPVITTVAGDGAYGSSGDGLPATNAQLGFPSDVEVDVRGNVYIVELDGGRVRRVDADTGRISTVVGPPTGVAPSAPGEASGVDLEWPTALAVSPGGDVYVGGGNGSHRMILRIAPDGAITPVAGRGGERGFSGDGGPATEASMSWVRDIAVDAAGTVYFTDFENHRVRMVDTSGIIDTIAGTGEQGYEGDGGPAVDARLNHPAGIFVDDRSNIYIADQGNDRVRRIDPRGVIHTVAGDGKSGYAGDGGPAKRAWVGHPSGVSVDAHGDVFIASRDCFCVREVNPMGIITTVAGRGIDGFSGDGGPARLATFGDDTPRVALGPDGSLYIVDAANYRIRRVVFP